MDIKTTYFGKIITDFEDSDPRRLYYKVGTEVEFTKEEYEFGSKLVHITENYLFTIKWSDVEFYKKTVTRTEIVTKTYKL